MHELENHNGYDEIDIKQFMQSIWKERRIISMITIISVVLMGIYTFIIIEPQYDASSELMIQAPSSVDTRFGTYTFPSPNISDYIQYVYSDNVLDKVIKNLDLGIMRTELKNKIYISIDPPDNTNRFQVIVSYSDPEKAKEINDEIVTQLIRSLRITYKRIAIDKFLGDYEIEIDNLETVIHQTQSILDETVVLRDEETPVYTLKKALLADPLAAAAYAEANHIDLSKLSDAVMLEEFANENFIALDGKVIEYKTQLIGLNENLALKKSFYDELLKEKNLLENSLKANEYTNITNGKLDVFSANISVLSSAFLPEKPSSPNKLFNMTVGMIIGIMLGIFIGLFRAYWRAN